MLLNTATVNLLIKFDTMGLVMYNRKTNLDKERKMSQLVLVTGKTTEKTVLVGNYLGIQKVTSFIEIFQYAGPISAKIGLGFNIDRLEGSGYSWGLVLPRLLIQFWRAMGLFDAMPVVKSDTLSACYYAAGKDCDKRYLRSLYELCGYIHFTVERRRILHAVPKTGELDSMLQKLRDNNIEIYAGELENEIRAGRLKPSPFIADLIRR